MIRRLLFRLFAAVFPKKYLPLFIQRLAEASYQRCEFPGYDIYLSPCFSKSAVVFPLPRRRRF